MALDPAALTISEVARLYRSGELSPVQVTEAHLHTIDELNPHINAFVTITGERALVDAKRAAAELRAGHDRGPLHGIPISLKDNLDTQGIRTTGGCLHFGDRIPTLDSTVARRLSEAGAVLLGKVNLHELALRVTTDNALFGQTRNPWDLTRIPGGSSGGSGAAVAAGLGFASMGSDTGGSVRIPASLCGLVGMKPTYGRVSRAGLMPMFPSYDCVGPLARTVEDCAALLQIVAGHDPNDSSSVRTPVGQYLEELAEGLRGVRVGVPRAHFFEHAADDVRAAVDAVAETLRSLGAEVHDVSILGLDTDWPRALAGPEFASIYAAAADQRPDDFSLRTRRGIALSLEATLAEHLEARHLRDEVTCTLLRALEEVDVLLTPTTPQPAPRIGEGTIPYAGSEQDVTRVLIENTRSFNFTRVPALSVPCGFSEAGLPIGAQLVGRPFDEGMLFRVAYAYQEATHWRQQRIPQLLRVCAMHLTKHA